MSTPHVLGWCNDGFHEGRELQWATNCPGETATGTVCCCTCHDQTPNDPATADALARWRSKNGEQ